MDIFRNFMLRFSIGRTLFTDWGSKEHIIFFLFVCFSFVLNCLLRKYLMVIGTGWAKAFLILWQFPVIYFVWPDEMPSERQAWDPVLLLPLWSRCSLAFTALVASLFLLKQHGRKTQNIYSIQKTMTPSTQTVKCPRGENVGLRWHEIFQHFKIQFPQKFSIQEKRMKFWLLMLIWDEKRV